MADNEYIPFAYDPGANVEAPATWLANAVRTDGFVNGLAKSVEANTVLRQTSVGMAAIAQAVVDTLGVDMDDDGSVANFETKFLAMMLAIGTAAADAAGSFGSGGIYGLTTANTAGFTTTRITIAPGACRSSVNDINIVLATVLTKRLDAAWAAGTNLGGRDTGALANGQTWHVFMILNPTTHVVDALFSQSATAPTLPAGFTKFRRIGSILLEAASTNIRQYIQTGNNFVLVTRSADYAAQANGGAASFRLITVPIGISVQAIMYFQSQGTASSIAYLSGVYNPNLGVPAAFGGATQWAQVRRTGTVDPSSSPYCYGTLIVTQFTDTSGHIYTFSSDASDVIALGVLGWVDDRGQF